MTGDESLYTADDEIKDIRSRSPHLVILGAGASVAALPDGDKNGAKLPLMNNLVEVVGLHDDLKRFSIEYEQKNFEDIYAAIHKDDEYNGLLRDIEEKIYEYFSRLELPETPTIYDWLVLGLRDKDVIATFNWDPFLFQALRRNYNRVDGRLPRAIYLHGNVAIGCTKSLRAIGPIGEYSLKTGEVFEKTKLLYPIGEKNYTENEFIKKMWDEMHRALKSAFMVTIFGYAAPRSDAEAIKLLKNAWGDVESRTLEEIEIIDIKEESELLNVWDQFVHTHHYSVESRFEDSHIFTHPRRSIEALQAGILYSRYADGNPFSEIKRFDLIENHLLRLLNSEGNNA